MRKALLILLLLVLAVLPARAATDIALPAVSNWTLDSGLQTYGNGIIRLTEWSNLILSDAFDDSSFDTGNFTIVTAYTGTVTETTSLTLSKPTTTSAAFVYYNTTLTAPYKIKVKAKLTTYTTLPSFVMQIVQKASAPIVDTGANWNTTRIVGHYFESATLNRLNVYFDTTSFFFNGTYFKSSQISAATLTANTYYWWVFINDGTTLTLKVYSDDESTLVYSAAATLQSIKAPVGSIYFVFGDGSNNAGAGVTNVNGFWHYGRYLTTSPVAESPWIPMTTGSVLGSYNIVSNPLGGTGTVRCQAAVNGGGYNGTWTTMGGITSYISGTTTTSATQAFRAKCQFNSDGTQAAELGIASYLTATIATGGTGTGGQATLMGGY